MKRNGDKSIFVPDGKNKIHDGIEINPEKGRCLYMELLYFGGFRKDQIIRSSNSTTVDD